jgi:thiosulfate dehydrogenase [quinone] large subunit
MLLNKIKKTMTGFRQDLLHNNAYLLPLRFFIGIGWIRASLEKLTTSGWPQGIALEEFFNKQLSSSSVVFPFYQRLITNVFSPHAHSLSWTIMIGQMLVGLAILTGTLTNFALIWGLFMNLNFILAGQVTPSAFYVVIQAVLFISNAGVIIGLDRILSRRISFCFLSAQTARGSRFLRLEKVCFLLTALVAAAIAAAAIPYIRDYGPGSVEDPAMLMLVLSFVTGLTALITGVQIHSRAAIYEAPVRRIRMDTDLEQAGS